MNINASLIGQFLVLFVPLMAYFSYYFGKRKTTHVGLVTVIGTLLAFIPPLALIYVALLSLKSDVVHIQ